MLSNIWDRTYQLFAIVIEIKVQVRMEVASSRPDHLPTLSTAKTSELSLLRKSPFW